jgi:glycosyltransferase involved in cell wall biosynthesis
MANWLKSRKVRFVLDVKDAWPDILERAFPTYFKSLAKLFLLPFNIASSRVFRISPGIVSISEEFLDWCLRKAKRPSSKYDFVLPLVTTFPKFDWENLLKNSDKPIGLFVGSISEAFDFDSILCSVTQNQAIFVIAGSGTRYQQVKKKFYNFSNVFFPGDIDVKQYYSLAKFCNFYFAPYKKLDDFKMSVPNKFYDALFFGLPFITSLEGSTKKLIEEERVGVVFDINEPRSLVEALNYFSQKGIEELMSRNALKFYEKNYDSKRIYSDFVAQVLEPIKCN